MQHLTMEQLEAGLDHIRQSPKDHGTVELIVRRPDVDQREVLDVGRLDPEVGLVGDNWSTRGSRRTADGSSHPDMQLNVMNSRCVALVAQHPDRWQLAGDQLIVDLDLSKGNLPAGTRLRLGEAIIEITAQPHRGCAKFTRRFGIDAHRFVNSEIGKELGLRGLNAKVVASGTVRPSDAISKIET